MGWRATPESAARFPPRLSPAVMPLDQRTLAIQQLEDAIALFLDRQSYASATTLAGAAEEILGKALEREGIENALAWQWTMQEAILKLFNEGAGHRKTFNDESNRIRNILKHYMEDDVEPEELQDAAVKMIIRANENAARLKLGVNRISEFEHWFYVNVVGHICLVKREFPWGSAC